MDYLNKYSREAVRAIVALRYEVKEIVIFEIFIPKNSSKASFSVFFTIEWLCLRKVYSATPVLLHKNKTFSVVSMQFNEPIRRYLRHKLRSDFDVRHLHGVRVVDNQARVLTALSMTQFIPK